MADPTDKPTSAAAETPAQTPAETPAAGSGPDSGPDSAPDSAPASAPDDEPDGAPDASVAAVPGGPDDAQRPPGIGRRRLLEAMRPKLNRGQLLAGLLCAVLAFGLVAQVQQNQTTGIGALRQSDLIGLLDDVTQRSARLEEEARRLEQQRDALQSGSDRSAEAQKVAQQRLEVLQVLAGTVPVEGPGIRLEITDPQSAVPAATILDAVQELRDAGAEAMQIADQRIVAQTAFTDSTDGPGIVVNGARLTPPYTLLVVGDPTVLGPALDISGGVKEALRLKGATGTVTDLQTVRITALRPVPSPQYARPSPAASP